MSAAEEHLSRRTVLRRIGAAVALPSLVPAATALGQTATAGRTRLAPVPKLELSCRTITAFKPNGDFDEEGQRLFCQRMIASKITMFPASGGYDDAFMPAAWSTTARDARVFRERDALSFDARCAEPDDANHGRAGVTVLTVSSGGTAVPASSADRSPRSS